MASADRADGADGRNERKKMKKKIGRNTKTNLSSHPRRDTREIKGFIKKKEGEDQKDERGSH